MKSEAHILLEIHMKELGMNFEPEFQFHHTRKWRFDYIVNLPRSSQGRRDLWDYGRARARRFAVEIEGGIFKRGGGGRHTRGAGYLADLEKYREATRMGYRVYRFSTDEVLNGTARQFLSEL